MSSEVESDAQRPRSASNAKAHFNRACLGMLILICIAAPVVMIVLFLQARQELYGSIVEVANLTELERLTEIKFPPEARLAEAEFRDGWHYIITAKVVMPKAEATSFLHQPALSDGGDYHDERAFAEISSLHKGAEPISSLKAHDWDLSRIRHYNATAFYPTATTPRSPYPRVGVGSLVVDMDAPDTATVYMFYDGD
jgi:hypothetical protein